MRKAARYRKQTRASETRKELETDKERECHGASITQKETRKEQERDKSERDVQTKERDAKKQKREMLEKKQSEYCVRERVRV